eukprot:CAMPEP_0175803636 /NCGR_PEP_ID=MMETSP0097-20121207/88643_1 /TAXON_ID=311494 /ORGANISM="Alexandrium monilatum, Strain CCMP3105" /LENGTH=245 /DNA_ID=CAMNT_0017114979 /DNA_START=149 /DNA_END=883 /DNA_ORIENTATION=+
MSRGGKHCTLPSKSSERPAELPPSAGTSRLAAGGLTAAARAEGKLHRKHTHVRATQEKRSQMQRCQRRGEPSGSCWVSPTRRGAAAHVARRKVQLLGLHAVVGLKRVPDLAADVVLPQAVRDALHEVALPDEVMALGELAVDLRVAFPHSLARGLVDAAALALEDAAAQDAGARLPLLLATRGAPQLGRQKCVSLLQPPAGPGCRGGPRSGVRPGGRMTAGGHDRGPGREDAAPNRCPRSTMAAR